MSETKEAEQAQERLREVEAALALSIGAITTDWAQPDSVAKWVQWLCDERDEARAEVERLQAAFKPYALHLDGCIGRIHPRECVCGLTALLGWRA